MFWRKKEVDFTAHQDWMCRPFWFGQAAGSAGLGESKVLNIKLQKIGGGAPESGSWEILCYHNDRPSRILFYASSNTSSFRDAMSALKSKCEKNYNAWRKRNGLSYKPL